MAENMPFTGIESEGEFEEALREYREGRGLGLNLEGARFDPLGDEERGILKELLYD